MSKLIERMIFLKLKRKAQNLKTKWIKKKIANELFLFCLDRKILVERKSRIWNAYEKRVRYNFKNIVLGATVILV